MSTLSIPLLIKRHGINEIHDVLNKKLANYSHVEINYLILELGKLCLKKNVYLSFKHLNFLKENNNINYPEYRRNFIEIYGGEDLGKTEAVSILKENKKFNEVISFLHKFPLADKYLHWANALHAYIEIGRNDLALKVGSEIFKILKNKYQIEFSEIENSSENYNFQKDDIYVSFSLFGKAINYRNGAIENVNLIQNLRPEWKIIIYYSEEIDGKTLEKLAINDKVKLVKKNRKGYDALLWRYIPFYELNDSIVIVRDCDSIITNRELSLLDEWQDSNMPFHIIRDHLHHSELIMAGLFSGSTKYFPKNFDLFQHIKYIDRWTDQEKLRELYKLIYKKIYVHDSFYSFEPWRINHQVCNWTHESHIGSRQFV